MYGERFLEKEPKSRIASYRRRFGNPGNSLAVVALRFQAAFHHADGS